MSQDKSCEALCATKAELIDLEKKMEDSRLGIVALLDQVRSAIKALGCKC